MLGVLAAGAARARGVWHGRSGLGVLADERIDPAFAAHAGDPRQEEAALLAGGLRAALRVELPLVLPSALFAACFAFVLAINDFAVPDYVSSIGPKWNVYADEVFASWRSAKETGSLMPPKIILNAPTKMMKQQDYGAGYRYDHDEPDAFSGPNYFPEGMQRESFYHPPERGFEREIAMRLAYWAKLRSERKG